ncbi:MAG TPA: hypothetical protein VID28_16000 [Methylomirabilota bacterium]|jgi:hypothetical protein
MLKPFRIGDETTHIAGDTKCPECLEGYPDLCPCGGLIHAATGEPDDTGADWPVTRCDRCGRAEEELD